MLYLAHLFSVLRHKFYVLIAGRRLGLPWTRLLAHDLSKFSPAEWGPYARHLHGVRPDPETLVDFLDAVEHHYAHNPHHPEFWTLTHYYRRLTLEMTPRDWLELIWRGNSSPVRRGLLYAGKIDPVPMPPEYVTEMAADLIAVGWEKQKRDAWSYLGYAGTRKPMHADTRAALERELERAASLGLLEPRKDKERTK